MVVCGWQW